MSHQPGESPEHGASDSAPDQQGFGQPEQAAPGSAGSDPYQSSDQPSTGQHQADQSPSGEPGLSGDSLQTPARSNDSAADPDATVLSPPQGAQPQQPSSQSSASGPAGGTGQSPWGAPTGSPASSSAPEESQQF